METIQGLGKLFDFACLRYASDFLFVSCIMCLFVFLCIIFWSCCLSHFAFEQNLNLPKNRYFPQNRYFNPKESGVAAGWSAAAVGGRVGGAAGGSPVKTMDFPGVFLTFLDFLGHKPSEDYGENIFV